MNPKEPVSRFPVAGSWLERLGIGGFVAVALFLESKTILRGLMFKNDTECYFLAAQAVLDGSDPYRETGYMYPPVLAILLVPLLWLGIAPAVILWSTLLVGVGIASVMFLASLLSETRGSTICAWSLLLLFLVFRPLDSNHSNGQINTLMLGSFVGAMWCLGRGRDAWAGVMIGLGAVVKVLPLGMGLYFVLTRRWRGVAALAGVLLVFGLGMPVATLGGRMSSSYQTFFAGGVGSAGLGPETGDVTEAEYVPGHSLKSTIVRLLRPSDAISGDARVTDVVLVELSPATVRALHLLACLIVSAVGLFLWTRRNPEPACRLLFDFAVAVLVLLLVAPLVRKAYYLLMVIPYTYMIVYLRRNRCSVIGRDLAWGVFFTGLFILAVVLFGITPPYGPIVVVLAAMLFVLVRPPTARIATALAFSTTLSGLTSRAFLGRSLSKEIDALTNMTFVALVPLIALFANVARAQRPDEQSTGDPPLEAPRRGFGFVRWFGVLRLLPRGRGRLRARQTRRTPGGERP